MAQSLELSEFGQFVSVNNAANTASVSALSLITPIYANGVVGTAGQVLTSNGATGSPYWTTAGVNTAAQYAWTNTHTFAANLTISNTSELIISSNAGIYANGSIGTSGQVLTSNGTTVYWAAASGGFTNGQSIMVSNVAFSNTSNTASVYTYYNTTTASLDTVFV